jgi:hypothetical protein
VIKAGSAGSNPDGVAKGKVRPTASQPLANLLQQLGDVTFCVNTAAVGLDAVEKGHPKPDSLDISWDPTDVEIAARKTRKFVLDAVLVRSAEAINDYIDALSELPRHIKPKAQWNSKTSRAEKARDILTNILGEKNYLIESVVLIIHWRNRIIHPSSTAALKTSERAVLFQNEEQIAVKYKNLSIVHLLAHFERDRATLKDVSSLISMTINMARCVDAVIFVAMTKADLDAWLSHYGLSSMINKVRSESAPDKLNAALERLFKSQAPNLLDSYKHFYP